MSAERSSRESEALSHRDDELESEFLYGVLAKSEHDPRARRLFADLGVAARGQAAVWEKLAREELAGNLPAFTPSRRARLVAALARRVGARRLKPMLAAMKVRGLSIWSAPPAPGHAMPTSVEDVGARHRGAQQGSNLRAAVFGVSDGLVSNTSLILGVSGASADPKALVIAGFAGLLSGAASMAAGEYVSVRSQRELFENQIGLERAELAQYPVEEEAEVALIYRARGLSAEDADRLAHTLMADPERALDTLAREELGLDPTALGSPWAAAIYSFAAFAVGAALPLLPLFFAEGTRAVLWSAGLALAAMFGVGASLSLFTGRGALWSGLRQALIGGAAAGATFGIGRLFGVAVA